MKIKFGQKVKTLFREQEIVSLPMALGMTIRAIIGWVRGCGTISTPTNSGSDSVKDLVKKQLTGLGRALAWLAEKVSIVRNYWQQSQLVFFPLPV